MSTEITNLEKVVAENQEALDAATAICEKEVAEEKDSLQAISTLKSAVTVLSKHHGGAFSDATHISSALSPLTLSSVPL